MGAYSRTYNLTDGTTAYGSQVAFELDALGTSTNNIVNAQISSGAAIADGKLGQISTPGKVSGAAITLLTSLPSAAGEIPSDNLNIASQAEMETATDTDALAVAGRVQNHPGVVKGWISFDGSGTPSVNASHNFDSGTGITENPGAGDYTIPWDTDFSSANYCVIGSVGQAGSVSTARIFTISETSPLAAGTTRVCTGAGSSDSHLDMELICFAVLGDQ